MPQVFSSWEVLVFATVIVCTLFMVIPGPEIRGDIAYRAYAYESARQDYARALRKGDTVIDLLASLPERIGGPILDVLSEQYYAAQRNHLLERLTLTSGYLEDRAEHVRYAQLWAAHDPADDCARRLLIEGYLWNERFHEALPLVEEERRQSGFDEQRSRRLIELYSAVGAPERSVPLLEELLEKTDRREYRLQLAELYHSLFNRALRRNGGRTGAE